MKNLILLLVAFSFGAFSFGAVEWNPILGGALSILGFSLAKAPQGVLRDGLDLSAVTAQLGSFFNVYSREIWNTILSGVNIEDYMKPVSGVKSKYVTTTGRMTEILQAYQKGFQAKGELSLNPYINTAHKIKIDYLLDDLISLKDTYLGEMMIDESKTVDNYPFVRWIIMDWLMPKVVEEMRKNSVVGDHLAPTLGTAGLSINSTTGIFTIIADEITAGNLTNIYATGAINAANIVDKVEDFHKSLPYHHREQAGFIFMSASNAQNYKYGYRDAYGTNQDFTGPTMSIFGTQKQIVGLPDLDGSNRFMFTPTGVRGNMLKMFDKLTSPNFTTQLENREVKILGDFTRGYGFDTLDEVFVNDQA